MKLFNLLKNIFNKKPKEESKQYDYVQATVEWLDNNPSNDIKFGRYVGEINYYVKNDKTYFYDDRSKKFFCDYDVKNPSKEVLHQMIKETTFTPTEFEKDV